MTNKDFFIECWQKDSAATAKAFRSLPNDMSKLNRVVTQAFSQRRKTLRNSLKKLIAEEDIVALGIDSTLRAESISLADFARLSNLLPAE